MLTFTFTAFSRCLYQKQPTISTFVRRRRSNISVGTVRIFIEPSAKHIQSKITRIRCYTMQSTIFKCQDVEHTISAFIK